MPPGARRTYAHAMALTMATAGRMNEAPATRSPAQPARACPIWIASSVELGPGMRFVAPM